MSFICHLDGSVHEDIAGVHAVLKRFRVKQETYWWEVCPRRDLLTNELIPYKDYNQYINQDFVNQNNFKKWIKANPTDGMQWMVNKLKKRKEEKNLKYSLGQIEMKLLDLPSILWINKNLIGGYEKICNEVNLEKKFTNNFIDIDSSTPLEIIEDTREQKPLKFPEHIKIIRKKLDYGDITLASDQSIAIERKGLSDACGTLSKGYERFLKEINRAKKKNGYIIICVEESFDNFKSIAYLPHTKCIKASYSFLAHRIREIYNQFDNIQFCFCDGREHMSKVVEFILKSGKIIENIDIQLLIDSKQL